MKTPLKGKNMGDRYMNDFAPVQEAEYVYAEAADGSQVKIKKSDLFSVLFQDRGNISGGEDLNNYTTPGMYQYFMESGHVLNGPSMVRIVLVCFKSSGHVAQVALSVDPGAPIIKYRASWDSGANWNPWKTITLT